MLRRVLHRHGFRIGLTLLLLAQVVVLINSAWLSDDAFITFRTIDNFSEGFGLRWNVGERVQSYTHPLWMLLLLTLRLMSGEIYWTSLGFSALLATGTALLLVFRVSVRRSVALLAFFLLLSSRAYVDYSTSGLENPLSYLMLALFAWVYRAERPSLLKLSVLAALLMLNRTDTVLLVGPALAWQFWQQRNWKSVGWIGLGFVPLLSWHVFATLYYGFPLPNTAYAKLATGIAHTELIAQGWWYFVDSARRDPPTLLTIAAGLALAFRARDLRWRILAAGVVLHLFYLLWIGGDFMSGRFLTLPFLLSVIFIAALLEWTPRRLGIIAGALLLLGVLDPGSPLRSNKSDYEGWAEEDFADPHGIVDERGFYYRGSSPLLIQDKERVPSHRWANLGRRLRRRNEKRGSFGFVFTGEVGMKGFFAGPTVHIVDRYALTEPLMARLPVRGNYAWRIGHFERLLPVGYFETLETGQPQMTDLDLASYAGRLNLITRAPVFDPERLRTLIQFNLGRYDDLLTAERERVRNAPADVQIGIE